MRIWIALLCLLSLACEDKLSFLRPMEVTSTPTEVSSASIPLIEVDAGPSDTSAKVVEASVMTVPEEAAAPDDAHVLQSTQVEVDSGAVVEAGVKDSGGETSTGLDAAPSSSSTVLVSSSDVDAAPACPIPDIQGSECNFDLDCGCAEGQACRVANIQTGQTLCFESGHRKAYESCEADQDCVEGSYCERGLCYRQCDIPGAFCTDDAWCGPLVSGGRNVCQGHCNVLPLALNHNDAEFWIYVQELLIERGLAEYGWDRPFVPCGEGGYCHTGMDPLRPYPHCVAAFDYRGEGEECLFNQECATGHACYEGVCRIIAFTSDDCADGTDVVHATVDDPTQWVAPDGYNSLKVCLPDP